VAQDMHWITRRIGSAIESGTSALMSVGLACSTLLGLNLAQITTLALDKPRIHSYTPCLGAGTRGQES
jgi:hypothetical protein